MIQVAQIAGGIALFLYGLSLITDHLKEYAGARMKLLLGLLAHNRWLSLAMGALLAMVFQSSSAATSLLVELTGSGLLSLGQALAVALGTGIGTSVTVQLISFRIELYALLPFTAGVILWFTLRRGVWRAVAAALMGFGLIFLGMWLMREGFATLVKSGGFRDTLAVVGGNPWLAVLGAAALTALVQSSAATIAVAMTLSVPGPGGDPILPLSSALAIVIGANIGTCATAFLASLRSGRRGRQVAVGNLALKLAGALLFMLVFTQAVKAAEHFWSDPARQIANFHTAFNVIIAILLAPVAYLCARAIRRLLPVREKTDTRLVSHADLETIRPPAEALANARLDVAAIARRAAALFADAATIIDQPSRRAIEQLMRQDDEIDAAVEALTIHLARIDRQPLSPSEARTRAALLGILQASERIGDLVSKDLAFGALRRIQRGADFSIEGARHLREWHVELAAAVAVAVEYVEAPTPETQNLMSSADADARVQQLHSEHYAQVRDGVRAAEATTSEFTDSVFALRQIHFRAGEIARLAGELDDRDLEAT